MAVDPDLSTRLLEAVKLQALAEPDMYLVGREGTKIPAHRYTELVLIWLVKPKSSVISFSPDLQLKVVHKQIIVVSLYKYRK